MEMKLTLFFCFITGTSPLGPTAAQTHRPPTGIPIYTEAEGRNLTLRVPVTLVGGGRRYLCREECKNAGIIIETNSPEAHNGRYSLRYHEGLLQVTVRELRPSDSGRYRCGVVSSFQPELYEEMVEIRVIRATTGTPLTTASSFHQQSSQSAVPLVVGGSTTAGGISVAAFLILLYKWKRRVHISNTRTEDTEVTYENWAPGSRSEDSPYQNLDPAGMDQEATYLTLS